VEVPILELLRLEEDYRAGTIGTLKINKQVFCTTLEPPDLLNEVNVSSIPAQQYRCRPFNSSKFGDTFEVCNIPGRTYVIFHWGNWDDDTEGCILLGESIRYFDTGGRGLWNSKGTFNAFMGALKRYRELHLTIREVY